MRDVDDHRDPVGVIPLRGACRLAHSSAAVTLDTYTHLRPDSDGRIREAVELALSAVADTARTAGE
ncbi:MAG: hypothetical protein M3R63_08220 [Actinomycetota bacterium]|nr:hypothetical protein [Actinomycetota bacterium]